MPQRSAPGSRTGCQSRTLSFSLSAPLRFNAQSRGSLIVQPESHSELSGRTEEERAGPKEWRILVLFVVVNIDRPVQGFIFGGIILSAKEAVVIGRAGPQE